MCAYPSVFENNSEIIGTVLNRVLIVVLDFRTAQQVFKSIDLLKDDKQLKFKNPYVPSQFILNEDRPFPELVGRREALEKSIAFFRNKSHIRGRRSILATQGGSGSGKTAFTDLLVNTYLEESRREGLDVLIIPISFNGRTTATPGDLFHAMQELIHRAVFAVFFDNNTPDSWNNFLRVKALMTVEQSSLGELVKALIHSISPPPREIVICIDEITKFSLGVVQGLLHEVANQLETTADAFGVGHNLFVTALDPFVFGERTRTDRSIVFVPLSPLTIEDVGPLFWTKNKIWQQNPLLCSLIKDAGGHPRTLSVIARHHGNLSSMASKVGMSYSMLLLYLQPFLEGFNVCFPNNFDPSILKAGILGEIVRADLTLFDHLLELDPLRKASSKQQLGSELYKKTFSELIRLGYYFNTGISDIHQSFRPTFPFLQLELWCTRNAAYWPQLTSILLGLMSSVNRRMEIDESKDVEYSFVGDGWELFHAIWEVLFRRLNFDSKQESFMLQDHYSVPENLRDPRSPSNVLRVPSKTYFLKPLKTSKCNLFTQFLDLLNSELWGPAIDSEPEGTFSPLTLLNPGTSVVLWIGGCFPGTDIVIFDYDLENKLHITLVQTKYSETKESCSTIPSPSPSSFPSPSPPPSKSPLNNGEVLDILRRAITQWTPLVLDKPLFMGYVILKSQEKKQNTNAELEYQQIVQPLSSSQLQQKLQYVFEGATMHMVLSTFRNYNPTTGPNWTDDVFIISRENAESVFGPLLFTRIKDF